MPRKLSKFNIGVKAAIILAIMASIFILTLNLLNRNKIIIGVEVANIPLGFKNTDKAKDVLLAETEKFNAQGIAITYNNQEWRARPEDMGITLDIISTIQKTKHIGREKRIIIGIGQQIKALFKIYKLPVEINWDENKFNNFYQKELAILDEQAQNSTIQFQSRPFSVYQKGGTKIKIIPEKWGQIIDKKNLIQDLLNRMLFLSATPVEIKIAPDIPAVTESETDIAQEIIKKMAENSPYIITLQDNEYKIPMEDLITWIEFKPEKPDDIEIYFSSDNLNKYTKDNLILGVDLNEEKIKDYLTVFATGVNKEPVNAQLRFEDGRVTVFALSQNGIALDLKKGAENLRKNIKNSAKYTKLTYRETKPEINTEDINNLGITTLLGVGESNFYGSPEARKHNIKVGAQKFHGVLLKPNEEFSFNNILGVIGPQTGYVPELVIKKNKLIPEYGGGLCQVSTTAFRAAVKTGLKITERFPHAFPVTYYNPQGFDATIYPPHPDLRFINNTPNHLLMQTRINGNKLIFEFYGANDGRKVEVLGPYQYDIKPDGSMKTKLTQRVYDASGGIIIDKTFYSNYKSPSLYPIERNPLE